MIQRICPVVDPVVTLKNRMMNKKMIRLLFVLQRNETCASTIMGMQVTL